jgi:hypothetical protein
MLAVLFQISSSEFLASSSEVAGEIFNDLMPIVMIFAGILLLLGIVSFFIPFFRQRSKPKISLPKDWFEREEREYRKVQEMIKRKDVKAMEEWLEKWRKGEISW